MILNVGELGIKTITYSSSLQDSINYEDNTPVAGENFLPNMIIYKGMEIKGTVSLYTGIKVFNSQFVPDGTTQYIIIGEYALVMDSEENAKNLFKIIHAIISIGEEAEKTLNNMLTAAEDIFFQ